MADKAEFKSDVGQAVMGNVNEAPRLNNVVHVNLNGEQKKPKPITNLQRKSIAAKVKELVQLGDMEQLDVYRVILTDFSVETIAELPSDHYKAVMALLDDWIAETKGDTQPPLQRRVTDHMAPVGSMPLSCASCKISIKAAREARLMTMMQTGVILVTTALIGWLIWSKPVPKEQNCRIDGKAYAIGSAAKMVNGAIRECVAGSDGRAPYWDAPSRINGR